MSPDDRGPRVRLRTLASARSDAVLPACVEAWAVRVAAECGVGGVYLSLERLAALRTGTPHGALVGLSETADALAALVGAADLPVVVEVADGFGNALNVQRAVRLLERLGAAAIEIADAGTPGTGIARVAAAEFAGKIRAAVDARVDPGLAIVARLASSDDVRERAGSGGAGREQDVLARAHAVIDAGADFLRLDDAAAAPPGLHAALDARVPLIATLPVASLPAASTADRGANAAPAAGRVGLPARYAFRIDVHGPQRALERAAAERFAALAGRAPTGAAGGSR